MKRYIFHLAIPVADLAAARAFYTDILGATIGRENAGWLDILLWGHQIALYLDPDGVRPVELQGNRHFGVVLPWVEWEALAQRLQSRQIEFLRPPEVLLAGTPQEQAKLYLQDPGNNVIEIKAYRDFGTTLGMSSPAYNYEKS